MMKYLSWKLVAPAIGLSSALVCSASAWAQEAVGDWHGHLAAGPITLRVEVHIEAAAGGTLGGTAISPDQSPQAFPLSEIELGKDTLTFAVPQVDGRYSATWDAQQKVWKGTWTQGAPMPLVLRPGKLPPVARPQEPKPPYSYGSEEVSIDSTPGVRLSGTLTTPKGAGPFPAVFLITGSGPQNRDEELLGHKPFLVLADYLTRQGIAVLRVDDRGIGRSTGEFDKATTEDFAQDAAAAVRWLRERPAVDRHKIGLIGHSEGAIVAPKVANRDPEISFVVLLAAPAVPMLDLMAAQNEAILAAEGMPAEARAKQLATQKKIAEAVVALSTVEERKSAVGKILADAGTPTAGAEAQMNMMSGAWFAQLMAYDPAPALKKLRIPLLALNGDKDLQVLAAQNVPALRVATKANREATIVELPGLNHLFQTSVTGALSEYGKIEETFSPTALKLIADWVKKRR